MSKQPPPAPPASMVGPCLNVIQIVGCPGTGSLPSTIAPSKQWTGLIILSILHMFLSGILGAKIMIVFFILVIKYIDYLYTSSHIKMFRANLFNESKCFYVKFLVYNGIKNS